MGVRISLSPQLRRSCLLTVGALNLDQQMEGSTPPRITVTAPSAKGQALWFSPMKYGFESRRSHCFLRVARISSRPRAARLSRGRGGHRLAHRSRRPVGRKKRHEPSPGKYPEILALRFANGRRRRHHVLWRVCASRSAHHSAKLGRREKIGAVGSTPAPSADRSRVIACDASSISSLWGCPLFFALALFEA